MKESWRAREAASTGARVLIMKASFDEFWLGENQFDFEAVNRRMQVALDLNPQARIMINLYCFMPNWWLEKNPDERTQWSNGKFPAPNHVEKQALGDERTAKYTEGKQVMKVIVVPKKIINIVVK